MMQQGTCQDIEELPAGRARYLCRLRGYHRRGTRSHAGALQAFVDNSLSKTVNFPEHATEEDVARAYMLAWELGCKGITVYVTGSREKVVLETKATAEKKQDAGLANRPSQSTHPVASWADGKKPRPMALHGETYNIETPVGKAFITINENGGEQPFEAFINTAKAGSETAAVSEAIGRLISYILRMASPDPAGRAPARGHAAAARHRRRTLAGLWPEPRALPAGWHRAGAGSVPAPQGRPRE